MVYKTGWVIICLKASTMSWGQWPLWGTLPLDLSSTLYSPLFNRAQPAQLYPADLPVSPWTLQGSPAPGSVALSKTNQFMSLPVSHTSQAPGPTEWLPESSPWPKSLYVARACKRLLLPSSIPVVPLSSWIFLNHVKHNLTPGPLHWQLSPLECFYSNTYMTHVSDILR